jgi:hypothetical protein
MVARRVCCCWAGPAALHGLPRAPPRRRAAARARCGSGACAGRATHVSPAELAPPAPRSATGSARWRAGRRRTAPQLRGRCGAAHETTRPSGMQSAGYEYTNKLHEQVQLVRVFQASGGGGLLWRLWLGVSGRAGNSSAGRAPLCRCCPTGHSVGGAAGLAAWRSVCSGDLCLHHAKEKRGGAEAGRDEERRRRLARATALVTCLGPVPIGSEPSACVRGPLQSGGLCAAAACADGEPSLLSRARRRWW